MEIRLKKKTQCERLLNYLLTGGKINPLRSWQTLGIYRLAARINDLRKQYPIQSKIIEVKNQFGDTAHVAQYWITTDDINRIMIQRLREQEKANG